MLPLAIDCVLYEMEREGFPLLAWAAEQRWAHHQKIWEPSPQLSPRTRALVGGINEFLAKNAVPND